jgi:tetratricopeptide (TPR) repeat protein
MKKTALFVSLLLLSTQAFPQETISAATALAEAKDYAGARRMLEGIVQRDGRNHQARFHLGRLLSGPLRDYDAGEEQLEKAVELAPDSAEYHFWLGNLYGIQAQNASIFSKLSYAGKVKEEFEKASKLSPRSIRYRTALMSYYLQAPGIAGGSDEKAREQATEIGKIDPYEGLLATAEVEVATENPENAEQAYRKAIEMRPDGWRAYHRLGYLYVRDKRWDDAIAQFRKYVEVAPKDANSHDSLGEALLAKGSTDEALASYLKALSLDASFAASMHGAAICYDRKGMKSEAAKRYRQYADTYPTAQDAKAARERADELEGK